MGRTFSWISLGMKVSMVSQNSLTSSTMSCMSAGVQKVSGAMVSTAIWVTPGPPLVPLQAVRTMDTMSMLLSESRLFR
ncbi:hypothetical protein D3C84_972660 [compost metagenome]